MKKWAILVIFIISLSSVMAFLNPNGWGAPTIADEVNGSLVEYQDITGLWHEYNSTTGIHYFMINLSAAPNASATQEIYHLTIDSHSGGTDGSAITYIPNAFTSVDYILDSHHGSLGWSSHHYHDSNYAGGSLGNDALTSKTNGSQSNESTHLEWAIHESELLGSGSFIVRAAVHVDGGATYDVTNVTYVYRTPTQTENNGSLATDLSTYNRTTIQNVSFVWETDSECLIQWSQNLNLSDDWSNLTIGGDNSLDDDFSCASGFASINTTGAPAFEDKTANLTMYDIDCDLCDSSKVIYASGTYSSLADMAPNAQSCVLSGKCSNFVCDNPGGIGNCTFDVTGFSGFGSNGNANLTINDSVEGTQAAFKAPVTVYAYYVNATGGTNISGANCTAQFDDLVGSFAMSEVGDHYEYNRPGYSTAGNHTWNATCSATGFTEVFASDWLIVNPSIPEFSTYALLLALAVTIGGFVVMKRRRK
ncbi:hypothetical protein ACFLZN_02275 [Nanoarchaeota archaeon]